MKTDWRDTVRVASDVAVLGLLVAAASLPVVTTGAALATGSAAVHHFLAEDRWPTLRASWTVFRRALLPGAVATAAAVALVLLVVVDLAAVSSGTVPGGGLLVAVTVLIAATAAGYAGLALVALGSHLDTRSPGAWSADSGSADSGSADSGSADAVPAGPWLAAARTAAGSRPAGVAAAAGVVALATLLAVLVHPILAACLVGYAVYALHAVARRVTAPRNPAPDPADAIH